LVSLDNLQGMDVHTSPDTQATTSPLLNFFNSAFASGIAIFLCGCLVLLSGMFAAQVFAGPTTTGYVLARTLVRDAEGDGIWSAYDEEGAIVQDVVPAKGVLSPDKARVISAEEYAGYKTHRDNLLAQHPTAELITRQQYFAKTFRYVGAKASDKPITKPELAADDALLLVRPDNELFKHSPLPLIIARFPVRFEPNTLKAPRRTALLLQSGEIRHQSDHFIGLKAAFVSRDGNPVDPATGDVSLRADDSILGGVPNVLVEGWNFDSAVTDDKGFFRIEDTYSRSGCFNQTWWLSAKLHSYRFNPRLPSYHPYYLLRPYNPPCFTNAIMSWDHSQIDIQRVSSSSAWRNTFFIDTITLSGRAQLYNPGSTIAITDDADAVTTYASTEVEVTLEGLRDITQIPEEQKVVLEDGGSDDFPRIVTVAKDFDGDGRLDRAEWGSFQQINDETLFVPAYDASAIDALNDDDKVIGVWFSKTDRGRPEPETNPEGDTVAPHETPVIYRRTCTASQIRMFITVTMACWKPLR